MDLPDLIEGMHITKEVVSFVHNNELEKLAKLAKLALAKSTRDFHNQGMNRDVANANHANHANGQTSPVKEDLSPNLQAEVPNTVRHDGKHITDHRRIMLQARRIPAVEASRLASRLWERDQDLDDRKMCIECSQLVGNYCHSERVPVGGGRTVLHRCIDFVGDSND